ncbi:MAG: aldose 1-epimerase [Nitrososphaerota archaeon]|nr:aldose 1-epimerase [Nitrososphaerota archaeon]MDG6922633.1 aldose 1-epimerase [Nitrososphaerota archaeon]
MELGAYVKSLSISDVPILKSSPDGITTHGGCAALIPFEGRIRNGAYVFEGRKYTLPNNKGGNAIHDFLKDLALELVKETPSSVELSGVLQHSGYPSTLASNQVHNN